MRSRLAFKVKEIPQLGFSHNAEGSNSPRTWVQLRSNQTVKTDSALGKSTLFGLGKVGDRSKTPPSSPRPSPATNRHLSEAQVRGSAIGGLSFVLPPSHSVGWFLGSRFYIRWGHLAGMSGERWPLVVFINWIRHWISMRGTIVPSHHVARDFPSLSTIFVFALV